MILSHLSDDVIGPACPISPSGEVYRVSPVSSTSVWVGATNNDATPGGGVYHRSGSTWADVPGYPPGFFMSAVASSDTNVWDVYAAPAGPSFDFYHWDGGSWTNTYSVPWDGTGHGAKVTDAYPLDSTHTWILVTDGDAGTKTLYSWDGSGWSSSVVGSATALSAVYQLSGTAGNLWAAGKTQAGGGARNGYVWIDQIVGGASGALLDEAGGAANGVAWDVHALSSSAVWACGWWVDNVTQTLIAPAMWHYDGSGWTRYIPPYANGGADFSELYAIHGVAGDDLWAVGYYYDGGGAQRLLAYHWDGGSWTRAPLPAYPGEGQLDDVYARARDDVWACGTVCGNQLVLHWDGVTWTDVSPPVGTGL